MMIKIGKKKKKSSDRFSTCFGPKNSTSCSKRFTPNHPPQLLLTLHLCSCCTATREHAGDHGTGLLFADPEDKAAEAPELPQGSRAFCRRRQINRLTTTNNTMRPNFTKDDEMMCVHLKILVEYTNEDPEGAEDDKLGSTTRGSTRTSKTNRRSTPTARRRIRTTISSSMV